MEMIAVQRNFWLLRQLDDRYQIRRVWHRTEGNGRYRTASWAVWNVDRWNGTEWKTIFTHRETDDEHRENRCRRDSGYGERALFERPLKNVLHYTLFMAGVSGPEPQAAEIPITRLTLLLDDA